VIQINRKKAGPAGFKLVQDDVQWLVYNKPCNTWWLRSAWFLAVLIDDAKVMSSVTFIRFDGDRCTDDVRNGSGVGRKFVWFSDVMKLSTTSRSWCTTMKSRSVCQIASAKGIWRTLLIYVAKTNFMGLAKNNVTNNVQETETNIIYRNVWIKHLNRYKKHTDKSVLMSSKYKNIMINIQMLVLKCCDYRECPTDCTSH